MEEQLRHGAQTEKKMNIVIDKMYKNELLRKEADQRQMHRNC